MNNAVTVMAVVSKFNFELLTLIHMHNKCFINRFALHILLLGVYYITAVYYWVFIILLLFIIGCSVYSRTFHSWLVIVIIALYIRFLIVGVGQL